MAAKRVTGGYDNSETGVIYKKSSLMGFIHSINPYQFISDVSEITIIDSESEHLIKLCAPPKEFKDLIKDTKVLNKHEITQLLSWRSKIRKELKKEYIKEHPKLPLTEEEKDAKEAPVIEEIKVPKEGKLSKKEKKIRDKAKKRDFQLKESEFVGENVEDELLEFGDDILNSSFDVEELGYESPIQENKDVFVPHMKEANIADMEEEIELEHLKSKETRLLSNFKKAPKRDIETLANDLEELENREGNDKVGGSIRRKLEGIIHTK